MKIKNGLVLDLANLLYELKLTGKDSRMRSRFRKVLATHQNEVIEYERKQLIADYSDKDENGEMIYLEENKVSIKNEFYLAYQELLNEDLIIEKNEINKEMLLSVANTILNTDYEFEGELADIYDIWCDEFENVIEYYKGNT